MKMETEFWEEHVAAAKLESISASVRAAGQASKFVALRVADAAVVPQSEYCILALPSGLMLSMPALPAAAWLAALTRAVSGAH